tara:strand:- start:832 stop:1122 length:291 start_codon:yes stop_codon:yes gene_type:complete
MKKTLKSGRNVEIKQMDIDDVDYCDDLQRISQEKDGNIAIYGINRSNTAWIRKGLIGGDFKAEINGSVPDDVIRELSEEEKIELVGAIRGHQSLGK